MVEISGNEDLLRENQAEPSGCVTVIMAAAGMEKMLPWNPFGLLCFEAVFAEGLGAQDRPFREEQLGPSASSCCRTHQWELSGFFTRYLGKQNSSCQLRLASTASRDRSTGTRCSCAWGHPCLSCPSSVVCCASLSTSGIPSTLGSETVPMLLTVCP